MGTEATVRSRELQAAISSLNVTNDRKSVVPSPQSWQDPSMPTLPIEMGLRVVLLSLQGKRSKSRPGQGLCKSSPNGRLSMDSNVQRKRAGRASLGTHAHVPIFRRQQIKPKPCKWLEEFVGASLPCLLSRWVPLALRAYSARTVDATGSVLKYEHVRTTDSQVACTAAFLLCLCQSYLRDIVLAHSVAFGRASLSLSAHFFTAGCIGSICMHVLSLPDLPLDEGCRRW